MGADTLPQGVVTIMFTDLVGSTALGDRLGDQSAQALRRAHDRILCEQFDLFRGRIIKNTGDGFMVAFYSARQAVACAAAIQRAIAAQQAEGRYPELNIRVGLHTGEPTVENGDLFGSDVNLAARIVAEAHGAQILVSQVTHLLARGGTGIQFAAVGERELRGFAEPVALYEVQWPEETVAQPGHTRFVGRRGESLQLREHLDAAVRGHGGLVLVGGEPGVGKTRLVTELAIEARDMAVQVLAGRAYEAEGMPPYLPFIEALRQYVRGRPAEELMKEMQGDASYLASLLPELEPLVQQSPEPRNLDPEAERLRVFESISGFLIGSAGRAPLLLFLDDLHWADGASLLLLQYTARRLAETRLLIVGTYRDAQIDERHLLTDVLSEVRRRHFGAVVSLGPLARDDAAALVEAVLGHPTSTRALDAIYATAEGNPFFTEELVRHLREQGHDFSGSSGDTADWGAVPEGVRQVIERRFSALGEQARTVLAHSSVLGHNLSLAMAVAVTGKEEDEVLGALEAGLTAHLLRERDDGFVFAHPLIQETLYRGLSGHRRRQLHLRAAGALESVCATDPGPRAAELAHHFFQAGAGAHSDKAVTYSTLAAERALSQVAYEEAGRLYRMALSALALEGDGNVDPCQRCDLLLALGQALRYSGEPSEAREAFREAAEIAKERGSPANLGRAALGFAGLAHNFGSADTAVIDLMKTAKAGLANEDSPLHVRVLCRLAEELVNSFNDTLVQQGKALAAEALAMARRVGDAATLARALEVQYTVLSPHQHASERRALGAEMALLAEQAGDKAASYWSHDMLSVEALFAGDIEMFDKELETMTRLSTELREAVITLNTALATAMRATLTGSFEEARRLEREAQTHQLRAWDDGTAARDAARPQWEWDLTPERLAELETATALIIERATQDGESQVYYWRCRLARLHARSGRNEEAQREFQLLAANDFAGLPRDPTSRFSIIFLSEVCALIGDTQHAATLYDLLLPYEGLIMANGNIICYGSAAYFLGLLARTMTRWQDAIAHFDDAQRLEGKLGARPFLARTMIEQARTLLARNAAGDRENSQSLLRQALAAACEMGIKELEIRARALLPNT